MSDISLDQVNKIYRYIRNDMPIETFMKKFDVNRDELEGILLACQIYGKDVQIVLDDSDNEIFKKKVKATGYHLNKKSIHYSITSDFTNVSNVLFLPEEPIMIATSEQDNSIKMYKFEKNTSIPQILKYRTGHRGAPNHIRFYGESANEESTQILSCDKYNLRNISLLSEQMSKEFSSLME